MADDEAISGYLSERIQAGDFPSAVYLVAEAGGIVFHGSAGRAVVVPESIAARPDTIYDLASLTKPLVTALLAVIAIERGLISPEDTLAQFFPAASGRTAEITIEQLATHSSGLPAWLPLYLLVARPEDAVGYILQISPGSPSEVIYSDLNFILLGNIIESVFGMPIERAATDLIFEPLGLADVMFRPKKEILSRIAASEYGNRYEEQTCRQKFPHLTIPEGIFRHYLIHGEVHDANAWFLGGAAGHAGLFGSARAVFEIAKEFLPRSTTLLQPDSCLLFGANLTESFAEHRSFGFQIASTPGSTAGPALRPQAFGHTGFTGTSLWIEPQSERIFILLTNRTHNHELPFANINAIRRRFHEIASLTLDRLSKTA